MNESDPQNLEKQIDAAISSGSNAELDAFNKIVSAIKILPDREGQVRVVKAVLTLLGLTDVLPNRTEQVPVQTSSPSSFSEDRNLSPKEFLLEKKPVTDIERVTCLAYYYAHYRNTPHFKTLDISKLNTDAAQIKLSNAAAAVENAVTAGYLVPAGKGNRQISAIGELYVQALPDRVAAKEAIAHVKRRRKNKKTGSQGDNDEDQEK